MRLKTVGRHLIAPLNARDKLFELSVLIGQFYQVTTYQTTVGDMLISENHSSVNNQGVPPAKYIRQTGRPKKRRIRSRGKKSATGCVDHISAESVVALMETTVLLSALLRPNIRNHVILFILHCGYNFVTLGTKVSVTCQLETYAPRE